MASLARWCANPRANPTSAPSSRCLRRRAGAGSDRRAVPTRALSDPLSERERAEYELLKRASRLGVDEADAAYGEVEVVEA